jgi:hypothetical protein
MTCVLNFWSIKALTLRPSSRSGSSKLSLSSAQSGKSERPCDSIPCERGHGYGDEEGGGRGSPSGHRRERWRTRCSGAANKRIAGDVILRLSSEGSVQQVREERGPSTGVEQSSCQRQAVLCGVLC